MNSLYGKFDRVFHAKRLYLDHPAGLTDNEVALLLRVSRPTVTRYRAMLDAFQVSPGRYTVTPTRDDVELADAIYRRLRS